MPNALFITLEGGEGAGKSTQALRLEERLIENGFSVLKTREPGGSENAEEIRSLLVNGATDRWSSTAETLLNYAARDSHLNEKIRPALKQGTIVICDRFMDSTKAYQGIAGRADQNLISNLQKLIVGKTHPDITFIFDLDPEIGLSRTVERDQKGEDRFEGKPLEFHQKLRQAFLDIAANEHERCVVIDADQSADMVAGDIWKHIAPLVSK